MVRGETAMDVRWTDRLLFLFSFPITISHICTPFAMRQFICNVNRLCLILGAEARRVELIASSSASFNCCPKRLLEASSDCGHGDDLVKSSN
jgi:hypothetical protein